MSSWVQWTARAIMLTAGVAAAGTGSSMAAFAQTRVQITGLVASGTGSLLVGNQIRTPVEVCGSTIDAPFWAYGNTTDTVGNPATQCWGCAAAGHGFGGDVLAPRCAAESWDGQAVAGSAGPAVGGLGSGCVCLRGPDAVTSYPPVFLYSSPEMPGRFGAYDPVAAGQPGGPPGLPGLPGLTGQSDRRGDRLGQAVQPWLVNETSLMNEPWLVNQSWQVNQIVGPGIQTGRSIQAGQESQTGQSKTSGATGLGTQLARLPLVAKVPLAANLPSLAGLASLGWLAGIPRLASAHGGGMLPLAAVVLLAGVSALKLAGGRRRGVRGARRGAMTS